MTDKLVIIDGNSLMYRAYYALPNLMNEQGEPVNAIFGFCKMLLTVISSLKPKYMVIAFDAGKHTFRHNVFEDYKGTRKPMPDDLRSQIVPLKELLKEMNIKVVEIPEIEADDIVGSCAKMFDGDVILISGDRDLMQLVDEHTTLWLNQKGISDVFEVNPISIKEKFGISPSQVVDMKAIMGDSSDNIPGVRGLGPKTAVELLEKYGSLDNIYNNIDQIDGRKKSLLLENKDVAYMSKFLATIKTDVNLNLNIEDCCFDFPFSKNVFDIMKGMGFNSITSKSEYFNFDNADVKSVDCELLKIEQIEKLYELKNLIIKNRIFAFKKEGCFHFALDKKEYVVTDEIANDIEFYGVLKDLFDSNEILKVLYDVKADKHFFKSLNIDINNYFDVSIALYIQNESEEVIDFDKMQEQKGLNKDFSAFNLLNLKTESEKALKESEQWSLYQNIELPLVEVLFQMEIQGVKIDVEAIDELTKKYTVELNELNKKIYELAGQEFNIKSPKQVQKVLFEDLALKYRGKKGTSVDVLEAIQDQHEIVGYILRHRKISKIISTYLEGMMPYVDKKTNKIHTTFVQTFTSTGRLSSREPNLQNIPVRDDESKVLRKLFISSFENGAIMSADYSQIELRLMAVMSKDENLVNDFKSNVDIHSRTASKIFNIPIEEVTSRERRVAKAVNFGIIYGISEYGLAKNINITPKEAREFIDKYFELYPQVKEYMNNSIQFAKENGYAITLYNRTRHIPQINSSNYNVRLFGERVALNMPLQGTASDIIKMSMINVYKALKDKNLKSKLILQIHDELLIDVYPGEEEMCAEILSKEMSGVANFEVPLEVSISYGKTWFDAK